MNWANPRPRSPEQVRLRHADVLEPQRVGVGGVPADLVVGGQDGEPRGAAGDEDRGELLLHRPVGADALPVTAVMVTSLVIFEPELVMNCLVPLMTHSPSSSRAVVFVPAGVRAGVGLRQPEPRERLAPREHRDPLLLLRLGAAAPHRHRPEPDPGLERHGDRLVDARELLDREAQVDVVAALPAVLDGERQAEQPHLPHLGEDLVGQLALRVVLVRGGGHDGVGEVAHLVAELAAARG